MTDTEISVSNPRISDGGYEKRCKICKTDLQRRRKRKTVRQKNEYATQKKKKNGAREKRIRSAEEKNDQTNIRIPHKNLRR